MEVYTLHFDGSCGPKNPGGTAAYGFTVTRAGEELTAAHAVIGTGPAMSNNLAEFAGLAAGLNWFIEHPPTGNAVINVRGDSQIVINIMSKLWKASSDKLYFPAYLDANKALRAIRSKGIAVGFDHIPREQNDCCDRLSKAHLTAILT